MQYSDMEKAIKVKSGARKKKIKFKQIQKLRNNKD